jgi:hypothetical protein
MKVCSTTFLSLSWPKLLSGKYWFSWFSGQFGWYSNTGLAGFQAGIQKPVNRFLDQLSQTLNRFLHCSLFLPVCCVSHNFLKTGSTGFGTGSTGFCAEKSKTASFGAPPIYTHSYLSPPQVSTTWTPFLT